MNDQALAVDLKQAATLVPASTDYLRRAVKRTEGNVLKAGKLGKRITVERDDLLDWYRREVDPL